MPLSFRTLIAALAAAGVVVGLAACDPLYQVGARQYLAPVPRGPSPDSAAHVDGTPAVVDIPRTAACLDTALRASPVVADVRGWDEPSSSRAFHAGMSFALSDSGFGGRPHYANLRLHSWRDERPVLDVVFSWIGVAEKFPAEEQAAMVRAATSLLLQLRAACLPEAVEPIECVAEGWGRQRVCHAAR